MPQFSEQTLQFFILSLLAFFNKKRLVLGLIKLTPKPVIIIGWKQPCVL